MRLFNKKGNLFMLKIINGYKFYGKRVVLQDINLTFENGKMYGIVGVNGSGKTLIAKALTGYIKLTKGSVFQDDFEIRKKNNYIIDAGIVIENPQFVDDYTVEENLGYLKKISENTNNIDLNYWYDFFGINEYKKVLYKNLSLGTKQKIALTQAFMHDPKNLILDEPFNALDKDMVKKVADLLIKYRDAGKLIIFITHINDDILNSCDSVVEVNDGKASIIK